MTDPRAARRCAATGLWLLPVVGDPMYRVGKPKYGALSAPIREAGGDRQVWGRYDSPGRTLYAAERRETAFAEVLSPFKRQLGAVDPLQRDAAALGITRDDLLEIIAEEWQELGFMGVGAIPRRWRTDRATYELSAEGQGWWIDVEHPDSLAALERALPELLEPASVRTLTTAVLRGENRTVTTAIGEYLRQCELDDGSRARGVQFGSKFGGGWCRAIWLPDQMDESAPDLIALSPEPILVSDEALATASERFRIRVF